MRLVATEYVSLDGVFEEPGRWSFPWFGEQAQQFKLDELHASDALLLGRVTYEGFAAAWPSITDEAGFAERMNTMRKHVVSSTLESAEWPGSVLVRDDVIAAVRRLREEPGRDLLLAGSGQLLAALAEADLVDQYRLMVHPVVLGGGRRLFGDDGVSRRLRLTRSEPFETGIVVLEYEPDRS